MGPTAQIGKNGLTPHIVHHLKTMLKARKLIKIKVLPSAEPGNRKEFGERLAAVLGARLIDSIGHMVVLQDIPGKGPEI